MFRFAQNRAWPPALDLSTMRETLLYMRDDARSVPGLEALANALDDAIAEAETAERKSKPAKLTPVASRFMPARLFASGPAR